MLNREAHAIFDFIRVSGSRHGITNVSRLVSTQRKNIIWADAVAFIINPLDKSMMKLSVGEECGLGCRQSM